MKETKRYWVELQNDTRYVESEGWELLEEFNLLQFVIDGRYVTCYKLSEVIGWGDDE